MGSRLVIRRARLGFKTSSTRDSSVMAMLNAIEGREQWLRGCNDGGEKLSWSNVVVGMVVVQKSVEAKA